jgi:hypothetical protein
MVRIRAGAEAEPFPSARFYAKQKIMKKAISAKQKSRGRPATGITPMMGFRADAVTRASVVRWAENQPDKPTLSEAIRRLVELGLSKPSDEPRVLSTSKQSAARAAELAAKAIDKRSDPAVPPAEREVRKRKLIQGPSPFRETRRDRPGK